MPQVLIVAHGAVLRQHQHDEGRADDIEHDLDRIDRDPAGAETVRVAPSIERPASATGNRKMMPCSIGTKIAGQRRISDLRRSRHSSAAVRNV